MTQAYTYRFTEVHEPGGTLYPVPRAQGITSTGWLDMANHQRIVFLLAVGAIGQGDTVDFRVEQALDANGVVSTWVFPNASWWGGIAITTLTAADGNELIAVEVMSEQMENNYRYLRGVLTIAGSAVYCVVIPLRGTSNIPAVPVTGWTEIVAK